MTHKQTSQFRVVDLFAGPGGLGEGFASFVTPQGASPFAIALSIEKDADAHQTLELRAFCRRLAQGPKPPKEFRHFLQGQIGRKAFFRAFPKQAELAQGETRCMELGEQAHPEVRKLFNERALEPDSTVVVGGPPCQAYSIAGRSRNGAKVGWTLESDQRSTLYVEYLRAISDLEPVAFVMENVRGLLSAQMYGESVFSRILEDLQNPNAATKKRGGRRYRLIPLTPAVKSGEMVQLDILGSGFSAVDFLVHSEMHGVPQSRTRIIVVGVREDVHTTADVNGDLLPRERPRNVECAIGDLPHLRSGLTGSCDSSEEWLGILRASQSEGWFRGAPKNIRTAMKDSIARAAARQQTRGSEFTPSNRRNGIGGILHHSSRSHMPSDLHRYLFASSFASVNGVSPTLRDFPKDLLPAHLNIDRAISDGAFADRFRVQRWDAPSTTIVSHIAKDGHYYIHPDPAQCRSLTVREAARLQTFPDDYFFCGPRTSQYHQVGNAVPVELSKRIAAALHRLLVGSG